MALNSPSLVCSSKLSVGFFTPEEDNWVMSEGAVGLFTPILPAHASSSVN